MTTIIEETKDEKYKRRKRTILQYHLFIILGYSITQIALFLTRVFELSTVEYIHIAYMASATIGSSIIFALMIILKKKVTTPYAMKVAFAQFTCWITLHIFFVFLLNEMRVMGLFLLLCPSLLC